MGDVPDWFPGVNILDLGLGLRNRPKGLNLTIVETGRSAERLEIHRAWRDAMKPGECRDRRMPPGLEVSRLRASKVFR